MSKKVKIPTPIEILNEFSVRGLPEHFCIVPFTTLIFNPDGKVGVCRQKGTEHFIGDITKESVEDIWNNDYITKWRDEFLSGDIQICKEEISRSSCHLSMDNYTIFNEIELNSKQSGPMLKLTANFNGQCNLRCKMCDIWSMQNGLYDTIGFWDNAKENFFPFIKEVEMLSGEPFIQEDTYKLIDIVSEVNPDCHWSFTTNGHWKLNKKIKTSLDKINVKNIIVSVDSLVPERYSEIRIDGKLETVKHNIGLLKEYEKERRQKGLSGLELTIHYLVMKDNWDELKELVEYIEESELRLTIDNLYDPPEYAISSLPEEKQIEICEAYLKSLSWTQVSRIMRFFTGILSNLTPINKSRLLDQINQLRSS